MDLNPPEAEQDKKILMKVVLPEEKRQKYRGLLQKARESGYLRPNIAGKACGQLGYTQSELWNKSTRAFFWPLQERAQQPGAEGPLTPALKYCIDKFIEFLEPGQNITKLIKKPGEKRRHAHIFTDARGRDGKWKFENVGGLMFLEDKVYYFMFPLDEKWSEWMPEGTNPAETTQRINEAEALGALIAMEELGELIRGWDVTFYIDNTAGEHCLRKAYSSSNFLAAIAGQFWKRAIELDVGVWINRVPSDDNISDPISRGDERIAKALGAIRLEGCPVKPEEWAFLLKVPRHRRGKAPEAREKRKAKPRANFE